MKLLKNIVILSLLLSIVAYFFIKPVRVLLPELTGVQCVETWLCIDDLSKIETAKKLYTRTLNDIESKLTPFNNNPKMIFCSTSHCYEKFGFSRSKVNAVADFGMVIGPDGWKPHEIKHELVHYWHSENFGIIKSWVSPLWIREGMAYSLSDNPKAVLNEPFESYRKDYNYTFSQFKGLELKLALKNQKLRYH
ncbi:MAG: hypothetical protein KAH22_00055 [Thiotrichaceae bacterium]|nr:hypothetical protein [Thiotrichaceae bacterium]